MTPNPVCYNGVSQPKAAVHIGPLSLGVTTKDYRADTAQLWRAGISPGTNIVLYSDTYSKGIEGVQANSEPRIWWIAGPNSDASAYEAAITELVSRLPERSSLNYALLADYASTIAWLKASGKYALINCDYPEYFFADALTGCQTVANIETGYLGSFYGGDDTTIYNLANPTGTVGFGTHAPKAFTVNDFVVTGNVITGQVSQSLGNELGFELRQGAIEQTTSKDSSTTYDKGFVFEGIIQRQGNSFTIFELYRPSDNRSIYQLTYTDSRLEVLDSNSTAVYQKDVTIPENVPTYITFTHADGDTPTVQLNDGNAEQFSVVGTPIAVSSAGGIRWVIGAHKDSTVFSRQLYKIMSFKIHLGSNSVSSATLREFLHTRNYTAASAAGYVFSI